MTFHLAPLCRLSAGAVLLALGTAAPRLLAQASPDGAFRFVEESSIPASAAPRVVTPRRYRVAAVDGAHLAELLASAPHEARAGADGGLLLRLPYPDGSFRAFRVMESPVMEAGLAERYPELRTYRGQGLDDPHATTRLDLTPQGFHAIVFSPEGTVYLDPYRKNEAGFAVVYFKRDALRRPGDTFRCDFSSENAELLAALERPPAASRRGAEPAAASGTNLRTYRLALAGTGEYTAAVCNPNPAAVACGLSAMVTSMNRVNGIYEREVAIRMVLVANNNLVVYTNGASDPYTNGSGSTMLSENQTNLNAVIGSANYDIGHVFSTGGGGVASLAVPCTSSKARGVTGRANPVGDAFDVDYVAHEMGHQFGGRHTFNGTTGSCSGNRSASAAYEPGSGSTIMAYAGICGAEDLQPNSDDDFHSKSFDEIVAFSTGATGSSCAAVTPTGNTPPVPNAGASYTIPKQTPFTLTGSATDGNGDPLTYEWEEYDLGAQAPPNDDVAAARPIFRSFVSTTNPSRTFPKLSDLLNNTTTIGESLSTRTRTMTFRFTARDNRSGGGGVDWAATTVAVESTAGPFLVTAPNTAVSWTGLTSQAVTWNVASTNAAPVSCANVALLLSTDGGLTFPTTLAASTPNDGSENVIVPNTPTTTARAKVACVGNVFFDLSNVNFTIVGGTGAPAVTSVFPAGGPTLGGNLVTVSGSGFVSGASVTFGAVSSPSVTFVNAATLTATAPAQAAGVVGLTVTNPDTQSGTLPSSYTYFPAAATAGFHTLSPCRAVDTRNPNGPLGGPALQPTATRDFLLAGTCGLPGGAVAASVNVTIVSPSAPGDLRIYPPGGAQPLASTINFLAGQVRANNAIVLLNGAPAGTIRVFSELVGTVDLVVDVNGYFQ